MFCVVKQIMAQIVCLLLKKRWPDVVKHLKIDYDWSVRNIGTKIRYFR